MVKNKRIVTVTFVQSDALNELIRRTRNGGRLGVVTDMDGTISPLVPTPDAAEVTPKSRALLQRLSGQIALVAAISGRGADDLRERVGLNELVYVGNHGMERWHDGQIDVLPAALAYRPALERVIEAIRPQMQAGMVLQDKRITASFHYRKTADPAAVRAELLPLIEQAAHDNGLGFFEGKMVFEVLPELKVDKGSAFADLIRDYALDGALYLGDDVTDAAALRMAQTLRRDGKCYAVAIGVASDETPKVVQESADVLVEGVTGVESLLEWLSNALSAS